MMTGSRGVIALAGAAMMATTATSAAAETRHYVVSVFVPAMNSKEGDCPNGLNPDAEGLLRQILDLRGITGAEREEILADWRGNFQKYARDRGTIDGQPADPYMHPMSVPDPMIETMTSKSGVGFDLDGTVSAEDFTDPLTGTKGVDNQLTRVLGCYERMRGSLEYPSTGMILQWNGVREGMPAWLISVSGLDDMQNDDDVTIRITRGYEPVTKDVVGEVMRHMSYTRDPDPRTQDNVFHGSVKDGTFVSDEPIDFYIIADSYIQPFYAFSDTRFRLTFDGEDVIGYIGGFGAIDAFYIPHAQSGPFTESQGGINAPGVYHALRRLADGPMNEARGYRDTISATYQIRGVPAYLTEQEGSGTVAAR